MAESPNTKIIAPVVYEDHLSKIAAAFAKGCGGVIVDGTVPEPVQAEISVINLSPQRQGILLKNFRMVCRDPQTRIFGWDNQDTQFPLAETERWLAGQIEELMATGLAQSFDKVAALQRLMTVWVNGAISTQWHTDRQKSPVRPDIHLHIHGEGLVIADPRREMLLRMKKASAAYLLPSNILSMQGFRPGTTPDQMLEERGFQLIRLQPGQRLFFRDQCLHRSAANPPDQIKLRAAMF